MEETGAAELKHQQQTVASFALRILKARPSSSLSLLKEIRRQVQSFARFEKSQSHSVAHLQQTRQLKDTDFRS